MTQEINFFGKTNFRNKEHIFGIKPDDRRRHMYVIGKTGMGKTNLIQNMAIQDIQNGRGIAIVDPHGEFAEECLRAVPPERINDVIYFNPADTEFPIAFNVMEMVDKEYRHLIASGLVGVFKKIWADSWGPRLEYLLRNAILALLEHPDSTLLGVTRILIDKDYRIKVLDSVTDPVVKSFWTDEFTKYHDRLLAEAIAPIQNKVGQFLSSALIRNIVGQPKSSFNIREVMDNKKILIMNLSKGKIGEDNSALLGAMMITKIQLAAMARVDISEAERKDFYLYVDEFQNFATESFANILSEARKYRLSLILAHQYITQLDEKVRDAVFGNVGTLVTFRIGAMDAEFLEKEFEPIFIASDLVNLAKYNIYIKLMIDGISTNPFSAGTLPPIKVDETNEVSKKVIANSRERYGNNREKVEDKISHWSGVIKPEIQAKVKALAMQRITAKETPAKSALENSLEQRALFDTVCSACAVTVQVPFKPDGERPIFCKECMKDYRRQQANLQKDLQAEELKPAISLQDAINGASQKFPKNNQRNSKSSIGLKLQVDHQGVKNLIMRAMQERQEGGMGAIDNKEDPA